MGQLLDVGRHPKDDSWSRGAKNKKSNMDNLPTMGDMPSMPSKYLLLPTWVFVVLSILFPPAAVFMLKDIGLHLVILIFTLSHRIHPHFCSWIKQIWILHTLLSIFRSLHKFPRNQTFPKTHSVPFFYISLNS